MLALGAEQRHVGEEKSLLDPGELLSRVVDPRRRHLTTPQQALRRLDTPLSRN